MIADKFYPKSLIVRILFAISSLILIPKLNAQTEQNEELSYNLEVSDAEIDSIEWGNLTPIMLDETRAYALKLDTNLEKKYYKWLEKRVDDVYPFVYKAVTEYYLVKDSAKAFKNKKARDQFIKNRYSDLANQYEKKLKSLTRSRGQILIKLIERETKITAYDMIKELRGGFNAMVWNTAGGAFEIDLNSRFEPDKTREDIILDVIIKRGIANGKYPEISITEKRFEKLNPILRAFGK